MKRYISPSILCANLMNLADEIKVLQQCGADYLHVDIMDGIFVPNYGVGTDFIDQLRTATDIPLDIHFMVERPEDKLACISIRKNDIVNIHIESTNHPQRVLSGLRAAGARAGIVLNPATPLSCLEHLYDHIDVIMLMTVNPGFAGQKATPAAIKKISRLRAELMRRGKEDILISVDGNVSFDNAVKMAAAGGNIFVVGSSSIYSKGDTIENNFIRLRECICEFSIA